MQTCTELQFQEWKNKLYFLIKEFYFTVPLNSFALHVEKYFSAKKFIKIPLQVKYLVTKSNNRKLRIYTIYTLKKFNYYFAVIYSKMQHFTSKIIE